MPAAMPCKTPINSRDETRRSIGKHNTKYACTVDADESTRKRLGVPQRYHEDHITAKKQRLQWKRNGKIREDTGMAADESQKQERGDR